MVIINMLLDIILLLTSLDCYVWHHIMNAANGIVEISRNLVEYHKQFSLIILVHISPFDTWSIFGRTAKNGIGPNRIHVFQAGKSYSSWSYWTIYITIRCCRIN